MKLFAAILLTFAFLAGSFSSFGQNKNKYSGRLTYNGDEYEYETMCAGIKEMMTGNIESYGITVYKVKKEKKKQVLKTHCKAIIVKRNHSDVKKNFDHITFTTLADNGKVAPEVEGTSKKLTMDFNFDNFMLIPQSGGSSPVGSSSFDEGIKNMVGIVMKALDI